MLGDEIKRYMDNKGIKYFYIAKEVNISIPIFGAMLRGKRIIKTKEYFSICNALNVHTDTFAPVVQSK